MSNDTQVSRDSYSNAFYGSYTWVDFSIHRYEIVTLGKVATLKKPSQYTQVATITDLGRPSTVHIGNLLG